MYSVSVRGHMMIAHSFRGELFGPAQKLHGATYVVDVEFQRQALDPNGVVVDIGRAGAALNAILEAWNYQNLDEVPVFAQQNTTTEFLAKAIFDAMKERIDAGELATRRDELAALRVTLHESHIAWASYHGPLV